MKKRQSYDRPKEEVRAERIFCLIEVLVLLCGGVLLFVNQVFAIVMLGFFVWNAFFYHFGSQKNVIDEYECDGYPEEGLREVFYSWGLLLVVAIVGVVIYGVSWIYPSVSR